MSKRQRDDDDDDAQLTGTFLPWTGDGNALPIDVLKLIFGHLVMVTVVDEKTKSCDIDALLACRLVCHRWCNTIDLTALLEEICSHETHYVTKWSRYTFVEKPLVQEVHPKHGPMVCSRCRQEQVRMVCCFRCLHAGQERDCWHSHVTTTCYNLPCLIGMARCSLARKIHRGLGEGPKDLNL